VLFAVVYILSFLECSGPTFNIPTTLLTVRFLPTAKREIQNDMYQFLELPVQVMTQRKIFVL
jgi:hypothetical protein